MKLYHGSNMEIDKPDLSRSKPFKDFGQGFYLSPGYEQAHALAKQKTDQLQSGEPCVTIFELEDQIIKTSDLQIKYSMITVKNGHSSFYSTATVAIHILHTLTI